MVKYKDINVSIDITTKKTLVQSLDAVIYSHDSNAVRVIAKISKNGAPIDTDKVSLLLSSCNYNGYVKDGVSIKLDGTIVDDTATFELPNDILAYQGFLRLDFYIDWSDGSNDGGQPILFEIKKSTIDAQASTWAVTYISDFEQIKQRVSQAAQDAIDTIDTDETIAEFEADKQAVKRAKDEAITEIHARPSELDASISQARQIITNRPTELDEPIAQANQAIDAKVESVKDDEANQAIANKVADVTTASNNAKQTIADSVSSVQTVASDETDKIKQKSSEANKDIDDVKINAIATINSQTDLSSEVTTARSVIAKSASDTQVVADNATTAINKVVTDTQTLGQSESAKITAVLPQLQTQIQTTANNAETIKQQLQDATFPAKLTTAWANSADGVTDFTNVKPETNMYDETNLRFFWNDGNGTYFTDKTSYPYVTTVKAKTEGVSFNIAISKNDANVNVIGEIYTIYFEYRGNISNFITENGNVLYKNADFSKTYKDWTQVRIIFKARDGGNGERFVTSSVDGFQLRKIKFGHADKLSVYTAHPNYNREHSVLKYKGYGTLQSTNPSDYQWDLNPEYLLTKQQVSDDKLKQAIIALGGTV